MTSLLRQIVAGPRAKHAETGLDLCYVTSNIIATSGPSQTYPQRAYRNPLDRLVAFLDAKHGDGWAIWEFRGEGTGYPDEAVYHRIRHYPWPDHHPPPFQLVPMIMASMRNWLNGGYLEGGGSDHKVTQPNDPDKKVKKGDRVVVVHCKAGKGRSGSMACSYLISECGWKPEDALARFTERRMRPKFGAGVSIPSQLRWIGYVDRWTRHAKKYVDREIEVVEVHVWGLRHGVKMSVEGFVQNGKKIQVLHTFKKDERIVVEGEAPGGGGFAAFVYDMAGYGVDKATGSDPDITDSIDYHDIVGGGENGGSSGSSTPSRSRSKKGSKASSIIRKVSKRRSPSSQGINTLGKDGKSNTIEMPSEIPATSTNGKSTEPSSAAQLNPSETFADDSEPGGQAVIFKPKKPIRVPTSDVNIAAERRNRAPGTMGLTMVTAVAHVWFNAFFEGRGPENDGVAEDSGVFEIEWDKMDGIKGSSRKGTRGFDRIAVLWRFVSPAETPAGEASVVVNEPSDQSPVPQMEAADWKGNNKEDPGADKQLGLRVEEPSSADVSKASSIKSQELGDGDDKDDVKDDGKDDNSLEGVKSSGPLGEEALSPLHETPPGFKPDGRDDAAAPKSAADATAQNGFIVE
ncbi:phosphatases II [Thozetella sp. PMI_491]|nr:phosphatases II [Thozetella sp. PMI_491]